MMKFTETRFFDGRLFERVEKDYRAGCMMNNKDPNFRITQHGRTIKYWVRVIKRV